MDREQQNKFISSVKVCCVGGFNPFLPRNLVLFKGLNSLGVKVSNINSKYFGSRTALSSTGKYRNTVFWRQAKFWISLLPRVIAENTFLFFEMLRNVRLLFDCDVFLIPSYGNYYIFTVKFFSLLTRTPLVLDAHGSLFFQRIIGVGDFPKNSRYARILFLIDKLGILISDKYMTLSMAYKNKLSEAFGVTSSKKIIVVYTGSRKERRDFLSAFSDHSHKKIDILYWGSFKPFDGTIHVVKVAAFLGELGRSDIKFVLLGDGSGRSECIDLASRQKLANIEFPGFVSEERLLTYINSAKLAFGPLSNNPLSDIDLCCKVCESAAFGKAFITKDSPSIKELFVDGESVILGNPDNLKELAQKIIYFIDNDEVRIKIGENAYKVYEEFLSPRKIAEQFIEGIKDIVKHE